MTSTDDTDPVCLQAHPKLLEALPACCLKDLTTFCSAARVAGRAGDAGAAAEPDADTAAAGQVAGAAAAATAKLPLGEVKARLLQLLQAAQAAQAPAAAGARRKRKGKVAGEMAGQDAAATAAGISSYQAALHQYKAAGRRKIAEGGGVVQAASATNKRVAGGTKDKAAGILGAVSK